MKKIVLSLFAIVLSSGVSAQIESSFEKIVIEAHQLNQAEFQLSENRKIFKASAIAEISIRDIEPFLSYSLVIHTKGWDEYSNIQVYFNDGEKQSEPTKIELDPHSNELRTNQYTSRLYFTDKNAKKLRLQYTGYFEIQKVELLLFNPGKTEIAPTPYHPSAEFRSACPCPQPPFIDRDGWCPNGDCPIDATPEWTTVTHLIVHHSATSNTSSDWPAVVRSIWNSHVNGPNTGWDDIGYNWLIDPEGNIYQGRFDNQQGAHFCSKNQGTMGVCVIGTYTSELPTVAALTALKSFLHGNLVMLLSIRSAVGGIGFLVKN